jgi:Rieske Fe-S protein
LTVNRREFLRRVLAGSALLVTGLVSSWELLQNLPGNNARGAGATSQGQQSTATASKTVTVTEETVTSTKYVSGPSGSQSAASSQASQQTSQVLSSTSSTAAPVPSGYVLVAPMSSLAGQTSAYFNHPTRGLSLLLNLGGQWNAFSATCTHQPCTVKYTGSQIHCPCHGANFNPSNGAVMNGPAATALHQFGVLVQDANLYVTAT